jgi:RimJ/RimL family protein N-acetyltransferase
MKYLLEGVETERLRFRKLEKEDYNCWLTFFRHPGAADYLGLGSGKMPGELCYEWFKRVFYRYENDLGGMNMLIDKLLDVPVGQCGIHIQEVDGVREFEVGYSILPEYWGRQYATEAAIKSKECAFERGYSESVISIIQINNIRSQKVALKNGMKLEKTTIFRENRVNIFRVSNNK